MPTVRYQSAHALQNGIYISSNHEFSMWTGGRRIVQLSPNPEMLPTELTERGSYDILNHHTRLVFYKVRVYIKNNWLCGWPNPKCYNKLTRGEVVPVGFTKVDHSSLFLTSSRYSWPRCVHFPRTSFRLRSLREYYLNLFSLTVMFQLTRFKTDSGLKRYFACKHLCCLH